MKIFDIFDVKYFHRFFTMPYSRKILIFVTSSVFTDFYMVFEKFEKWKDNLRFWTWGGWRTRTWGWSRPCSTVCLRRSYETLLMLDPIQSRGSAIRDNFIFFLAKQIRAKFSATSSHLFSFFPLEIEVRNRHRAPKQQHNHSSQQAQAHHHAVTTQTLSRLTHTHSGKIGRGTFSAQATSQH